MNKSQLKLLEKYAAIALVNYDYHTDRKAYVKKHPQTYSKEEEDADQQEITKKSKALKERQKKNSTTNAVYSASDISVVNEVKAPKKVMTLTDPSYKVTEFKNEYNYSIKTDALVDPLYQTANRSITDISLSGKSELGLSFTRRYNSLNSKALTPEYNAVAGTYTQQTGNLTSPIDITQDPGFIAVGWSLNIPSMQKATIQAEVTESHYSVGCNSGSYQLTGSCYQSTYSYQGISSYEKVSFSLDTGESYEFRNEVIQNYPYQNVTYSKVLNGGHYEYSIILNETLTYKFDDQGHIISKTNQYGNQVLYSYGTAPNMDITVTDSFGRVITVSRNSNLVITGVTVKLGTNVIKQLQYNSSQPSTSLTSRKWTTNGYQNVTENLSYWQLDNVKDSTTSTAVTQLESYDYYPIDSTTLADFNFKPDGYTVDGVGPNGEMLSNNQGVNNNNNYWTPAWNWPVSEGGAPIEALQISEANKNNYGEIPYLLLKNVNFLNGLTAQFDYNNYNTSWNLSANYVTQHVDSGTTKLFQDKNILQYVGIHAVQRVDYRYTENGILKHVYDYYSSSHMDHGYQWNEYWKTNKSQVARFKNSTRFGDNQTIITSKQVSSGYNSSDYNHYWNNGSDFVLTFSWNRQAYENPLSFSEDGVDYRSRNNTVTAYEYDTNQIQPKAISKFAANIPDYWIIYSNNPKQDMSSVLNIQNPLLPNVANRTTRIQKTFNYDTWGVLLTTVDEIGNSTINQYNGPHHGLTRTQVTAQDGSVSAVTTNQYYSASESEPQKNQLWKSTTIQNYKDPITPAITRSDTTTSEYTIFNANHFVQQMKEYASGDQFGKENTTTQRDYTYTSTGQVFTESTKATLISGQAPSTLTNTNTYYLNDTLQKTVYPDSSYVQYTYDVLGRVKTNQVQPTTGSAITTSVNYDDTLRKVGVTLPDGELDETFYTPFGMEVKSQRTVNGITRVTAVNLTVDGKLPYETQSFGNSSFRTYYDYDTLSRPKVVTDALGRTIHYYYSNFAIKKQTGGYELPQNTTMVSYPDSKFEITYTDTFGRVVKFLESDPDRFKSRTTTFQYSSLGKLLRKDITSLGKTETTNYGYDGAGNLIYVKDSLNQTYQYVYDRLGKVIEKYINRKVQANTKYAFNEVGWLMSTTNAGNNTETNQYKNNGLVDKHIDKMGQTYNYAYNEYNQTERISIKNTSGTEIYWQKNLYEPLTHLQTEVSNSDNEKINYHYDIWKRNDTKTVAGRMYTFGYDAYDRMNSITYPDLTTVNYQYDDLNRMSNVNGTQVGSINYTYTTSYNNNNYTLAYNGGDRTAEENRDSLQNLVSTKQYKGTLNRTWLELFTSDGFGNITDIDRNNVAYNYQYDALKRIKIDNSPTGQSTYGYDDRGNRETLVSSNLGDIDLTDQTNTYNAVNQLQTYQNTTKGTSASYTYYGDGLRATKTVNGQKTRYVYVEGRIIEELDASGNLKARNVWGNELLYRKDYTNDRAGYYLYNGHGDVIKIEDANKSYDTLKTYDYDIWGNIISETSNTTKPFNNSFGYAGEMHDSETGYIYLRARYYDPTIGRFINEDTYGGQIDNPLSLNLYTYVENNPLINTDPTGHMPGLALLGAALCPECVVGGLIIGAGVVGALYLADKILNSAAPAKAPTVTIPKKTELTVITGGKTDSSGSSNSKPKIIPPVVTSTNSDEEKQKQILYHYTTTAGLESIMATQKILPSLKAINPNDAYYGDGQYLSDIIPNTKTTAQLSRIFIGQPFQGNRFSSYVAIDVTGLNAIEGRDHVYVIPNSGPLDISGRIMGAGIVSVK